MNALAGWRDDRPYAATLAGLLRCGCYPMAHVYPKAKRDFLRRRTFFVRQRAQLIAHVNNTNTQHNLSPFTKKLTYKGNRTTALADRECDTRNPIP